MNAGGGRVVSGTGKGREGVRGQQGRKEHFGAYHTVADRDGKMVSGADSCPGWCRGLLCKTFGVPVPYFWGEMRNENGFISWFRGDFAWSVHPPSGRAPDTVLGAYPTDYRAERMY